MGSSRLLLLPDRTTRQQRGARQQFSGTRYRGVARRRRVGVPAHPGVLYRQRGLHDRREGGRGDSRILTSELVKQFTRATFIHFPGGEKDEVGVRLSP